MSLAEMRHNGVRSLAVRCEVCHRDAVVNVDAFDVTVPMPAFGPWFVRPPPSSVRTPDQIGSSARRKGS